MLFVMLSLCVVRRATANKMPRSFLETRERFNGQTVLVVWSREHDDPSLRVACYRRVIDGLVNVLPHEIAAACRALENLRVPVALHCGAHGALRPPERVKVV